MLGALKLFVGLSNFYNLQFASQDEAEKKKDTKVIFNIIFVRARNSWIKR